MSFFCKTTLHAVGEFFMKKNIDELLSKYNKLVEQKKNIQMELVELRTQYKMTKTEYDESMKKLKDEYNIETLEEAEKTVDTMYNDISKELELVEQNFANFLG